MRKWLKVYFGLSRSEFNGLSVLLILILLILIIPYAYRVFRTKEPVTDAEMMAVIKLASIDKQRVSNITLEKNTNRNALKTRFNLFNFDPNTIGQAGWEELGLSPKQAQAILRYRNTGGYFRKVEDLKKMYTVSEKMYNRLSPFVRIAEKEKINAALRAQLYPKTARSKAIPVYIEINGADTTELDKVKGIGTTFANRIVNYRNRLGGFHSKEQMMEVFGLDSAKYDEIKDQIWVDVSKIKKVNINTASAEDFKHFPYLRFKQTNALIQYRKQHGNYSNIADLNKVVILNQETIDRLAAYLEF